VAWPPPAAEVGAALLQESVSMDVTSACELAARAFVDLLGSPVNRALLNVYWLRRHNKRDAVVRPTPWRPVERVGIVGAGIMGIGIAAGHLEHGFPVHLADASDEALSRAMAEIPRRRSSGRLPAKRHRRYLMSTGCWCGPSRSIAWQIAI
jgi:hypothetical protein